jgi:hypothetical protein
MSTYDSIAWLPLCAGLTAAGLALTYIVARRRGWRAIARGAAWSLLPIAAYLTGAIEMIWKIGTAIGNFAAAFAFSPEKWAGIGVVGLAVTAFAASGGRVRRKAARERAAARAAERQKGAADTSDATIAVSEARKPDTAALDEQTRALAKPAGGRHRGKGEAAAEASPPGDDLKDVEEILRKHGI